MLRHSYRPPFFGRTQAGSPSLHTRPKGCSLFIFFYHPPVAHHATQAMPPTGVLAAKAPSLKAKTQGRQPYHSPCTQTLPPTHLSYATCNTICVLPQYTIASSATHPARRCKTPGTARGCCTAAPRGVCTCWLAWQQLQREDVTHFLCFGSGLTGLEAAGCIHD